MLLQYQLEHLPLLQELRKIEVEKYPIWGDLTNKLLTEDRTQMFLEDGDGQIFHSIPTSTRRQGRQPHNLSAAVEANKQNAKKH